MTKFGGESGHMPMATDIVQRLRSGALATYPDMMDEAADEIERLRAAAAEVVPMNNLIDDPNSASGKRIAGPSYIDNMMSVRVKDEIATTIERCAQVADAFADLCGCPADIAVEIAAAIRALKDKPRRVRHD